MKFKCGLTIEEYRAKQDAAIAKRKAEEQWHSWYAWRPVTVAMGDCRWFEIIQRRRKQYYGGDYYYDGWEYRAVGDTRNDI